MRSSRYMADISSNNGTVHLDAYAAAGHAMIAIKATEGAHYYNPFHQDQCQEAHHAGLTITHYHFCRPGQHDIGAELRAFRTRYIRGWRKGDYVALDLELTEGQDAQVYARSFLAEIQRFTGHPPILYTYQSFREEHLQGLQWKGNRWWIADYAAEPPLQFERDGRWAWQFTDGVNGPEPHECAGIGRCDVSILNAPLAARLWVRKLRTGRR